MAVRGIGNADVSRAAQPPKAEETRVQKQEDQTNREVPDTRNVVENGRGENMDLTA